MNELSCLHGSERYGACDDEAYQRGRNAGVRFPGRNDIREKRQNSTVVFKSCENSEELAVFVPLSTSISNAPDSEHSMPFRVRFHRTTKSHAE